MFCGIMCRKYFGNEKANFELPDSVGLAKYESCASVTRAHELIGFVVAIWFCFPGIHNIAFFVYSTNIYSHGLA